MTYFLLQSGAMFLAAFFIGCWCGCLIKSLGRTSDTDLVPAAGPALQPPVSAKTLREPDRTPPAPPVMPPPRLPVQATQPPSAPASQGPSMRLSPEVTATAAAAAAAVAARSGLPPTIDDLKRIKGIGPELEMKLHDAGVKRYAEIASWTPNDVVRVNRLIGQDGRIQHENWVEQAQILARGEETAFSRRMDRREVADGRAETWTPTAPNEVARQAAAGATQTVPRQGADNVVSRPVAAVVAAPVSVGAAAAAAAAVAASTTAAVRQAQAAPLVAPPPAVTPPAASKTTTSTSTISMRPQPGQGNLRRFVRLAAPEGKGDDISLISGIGDKVAGELNRYGIYHYWQLAAMGPDDIEYLESRLGLRGRIRREEWQEQARELMAGKQPRGALDRARAQHPVDTGKSAVPVAPPPSPASVVAPPVTAPRPAVTAPPAGAAAPLPPAAPPALPVQSSQPSPSVAVQPGTAAATRPAPAAVTAKPDDLSLISGIADKLAADLNSLGLMTFADLASLRPDEVDRLDALLGLRGRVRREEWQEQARELMAGKPPRGAMDRARAAQAAHASAQTAAESASRPAAPPTTATQGGYARSHVTLAPPAAPIEPIKAPPPVAAPVSPPSATAPPKPDVKVEVPAAPPVQPAVRQATVAPSAATAPVQASGRSPDATTSVAVAAAAVTAALGAATTAAKQVSASADVPPPASPPVAATPVAAKVPIAPTEGDEASASDSTWTPRSRASNTAARGPRSDLKRIKGIGVVIDKKLEAMGITTYEQIAAWTTADIDKVSNALDFKGRIEREQWVQQARILSGGGQTDFSRRMDRGDNGA